VQWLKHYYSNVAVAEDYDGFAEREGRNPNLHKKHKKWNPCDGAPPPAATRRHASVVDKKPAAKAAAKAPMGENKATRPASRAASAPVNEEMVAKLKAAEETIAQQKEELSELNLNVDALTKERDFYFGKLRDVEIMIQEKEGEEGVEENVVTSYESIKAILYATDDAAEEEY